MKIGMNETLGNEEALSPLSREMPTTTSSPPFASTLSPLVPRSSSKRKNPRDQRDTSMVTTRRPRPTTPRMDESTVATQTTPDAKRLKFHTTPNSLCLNPSSTKKQETFRIEYPSFDAIPAPSKSMLKTLLQQALRNSGSSGSDDQAQLQSAGILSLEQTILPAIALQEEKALKCVQARIQRDAPDFKYAVEDGRRIIRLSIQNAIQSVQVSRAKRMEQQTIRRQEALEQKRQERREHQEERARLHQKQIERQRAEAQHAREQQFRSMKRQYPRNKDLWREIVVLTRSCTQLEKEHRMWKQAQVQQQEWTQKNMTRSHLDTETSLSALLTDNEKEMDEHAAMLQGRTADSIKDIVLASTRIQQGLAKVLTILKDSEKTREQLYKEYRRDHHFQGYASVRNPKNLIRLLSQED